MISAEEARAISNRKSDLERIEDLIREVPKGVFKVQWLKRLSPEVERNIMSYGYYLDYVNADRVWICWDKP